MTDPRDRHNQSLLRLLLHLLQPKAWPWNVQILFVVAAKTPSLAYSNSLTAVTDLYGLVESLYVGRVFDDLR